MSSIKLSFQDPTTGRQHTIQTEVIDEVIENSKQSIEAFRKDNHDGKIDLFIEVEKNTESWESNRDVLKHLQIDSSQMDEQQVIALAHALKTGNVVINNNLFFGLFRRSSTPILSVTSDLLIEKQELFAKGFSPSQTLSEKTPLFLSADGIFSGEAHQTDSIAKNIETLDQLAEAIDQIDSGDNFFTSQGIPTELRMKAFQQLADSFDTIQQNPDISGTDKAKHRSALATIFAEMIGSLGNSSMEGAMKMDVFHAYGNLLEKESLSGLKESMIFQAFVMQGSLPEAAREKVQVWKAEIAPVKLPYDKWFEDGDLNVSFAAGHGEGFYEGFQAFLGERGFEVVDPGQRTVNSFGDGVTQTPSQLQLKKVINGKERIVNIFMRDFRTDSFKDINNEKMDILFYGGHSNLGGNTRKSLEYAEEGTGKDKLIFLGLCSGKDNLGEVRKAFPEAQLVTTFNSSYFQKMTMFINQVKMAKLLWKF